MASKQKVLSVAGLLSGAMVWGLMWYPYRVLAWSGVSGELSTLITYAVALFAGLLVIGPVWRELRPAGWWGIAIMLASGWTNYGYVLAILGGGIMRVLLLFYLAPFWTVLFARWMLGERLNRYGYAIIALSLGGAFIMLWNRNLGLPLPQNPAEWIGLSAGMSFALLNVLIRRTQQLSVNFKSAAVWAGAVLITGLFMLYRGDLWQQVQQVSLDAWCLLILTGVVLSATSIVVQYGLTNLPANQSIVIFISELVFAAVSSYFLVDEAMGLQEVAGAILIVSASLLSGKIYSEEEQASLASEIKT